MKKYKLGILKISVLILVVIYVILCIFLMEIPPFDTILPFGLIAIMIIIFVALIISFFWVAQKNMLMFEKNRTYENKHCMFCFDLFFGTCYQIIKNENKYYFIKIGNGLFTIKAKNICKDIINPETYIKHRKIKIVSKNDINTIKITEGKFAFDIATYNYDRLVLFSSSKFSKNLQSVFNANAEQLFDFFECNEKRNED